MQGGKQKNNCQIHVLTTYPPSESNNIEDNFASYHYHMLTKCSTFADDVANFEWQTTHNARHLVQ